MTLHLDVTNPQGRQNQNLSVELNKEDLQKVVASLEAANKVNLFAKWHNFRNNSCKLITNCTGPVSIGGNINTIWVDLWTVVHVLPRKLQVTLRKT